MSQMMKLFDSARCVSVPILVIRTADQEATLETIRLANEKFPIVQWDAARGLTPVGYNAQDKNTNMLGHNALQGALSSAQVTQTDTMSFTEAMNVALHLPARTILLAHNAHRQLDSQEPLAVAGNVQAVANVREKFKLSFRMLVLMAPQLIPPPELAHDLITIDHALPTPEELEVMVREIHLSTKPPLEAPEREAMEKIIEAISGLSMFEAEQVVSMSLTEQGIDLDALWERKRVAIAQTRGLSVHRGNETFDTIVGLESVKAKLRTRKNARTPIGVAVLLDELDKVFANVEHDTSGVKLDQMTTFLTEMEDNEWRGMVAVGVAGGGKTLLAKAFANEMGVPLIKLDFGGMEAPHVGESQAFVRQAIQTIKAVGRGRAYFIATSNNASVMRPEMQRRFTDGMFFFDVISREERAAAWAFYMKRYELEDQPLPSDDGWTAAEVRNCCREAWDARLSLVEAAKFILPMATSRAPEIEKLRRAANGTFLDANKPGPYRYDPEPMAHAVRAIELPKGVADVVFGATDKRTAS